MGKLGTVIALCHWMALENFDVINWVPD